jgi:molybdopterin-guanine dinucleotide biosynthesis protein A
MLHAVYRKTCLPVARRLLAAKQLRLAGLAPALIADGLVVRFVGESELILFDAELRSFVNVNTPEDLGAVEKLLRERRAT